MNRSALVFSFLIYFIYSTFAFQLVHAQQGALNSAYPAVIKGVENVNLETGLIVSLKEDGYYLSSVYYDGDMQGVINLTPGIEFTDSNDPTSVPLVKLGSAYVFVSNENGPVLKGDYITSSETPGVGIKSQEDGMVIGRALEDAPTEGAKSLVMVEIGPRFYTFEPLVKGSGLIRAIIANLSDLFNISATFAGKEPSRALRYILAIFIVVFSIIFAFVLFGRVAIHSIVAAGRNPLAGKLIMLTALFNVLMAIAVGLSGIVLAYIIIVL